MKQKIRDSAYSSPILTAIEAALFAVVLFSLPNLFKIGETAAFVLHVVCRAAVIFCAVFAAKSCGFKLFVNKKISVSEIFIIIVGLMVCVNNFPIIGFITGNVSLAENAQIFRYAVYCVMIGVAEEFAFRGFIMPLVGIKFYTRKRAPFFTVLVSSLIFSLCHGFNVFSAGVLPTLMQVGYTFLTGGLFGAVYLMTENIVYPIVLHVVFDVGGLMFFEPFGIAVGNMWDTTTIIITAALGVVATAVYIIKLITFKSVNQK